MTWRATCSRPYSAARGWVAAAADDMAEQAAADAAAEAAAAGQAMAALRVVGPTDIARHLVG
jgi:hypothetical protein